MTKSIKSDASSNQQYNRDWGGYVMVIQIYSPFSSHLFKSLLPSDIFSLAIYYFRNYGHISYISYVEYIS
jgi:hypothetical protein